MRFLLASESARRVALLETAGYGFEAQRSGFEEVTLDDPVETVRANASGKALALAPDTDGVVLAADTIVYLSSLPPGGRILGQAGSADDVERYLGLLQGRAHEVYSGVAVSSGGEVSVRHAATRVRLRRLGTDEIASYARHGEGIGKAGGYAIQGRAGAFVEWIGGDYTNVVGLPLSLTIRLLARAGIPHPTP